MKQLTYQPLCDSHASGLAAIWGDADVIRHTNIAVPCGALKIQEKIAALKVFDVFAVFEEDCLIGIVGCPCIDRDGSLYGVFYQFAKAYWGQGCATKAFQWLLGYMKSRYGQITLMAEVVDENTASERILTRAGFTLVSQETQDWRGGTRRVRGFQKSL